MDLPVSGVSSGQFTLSGTSNFRDLGGLRSVDGKTVKPGMVFRSAELSTLDDHGQRTLAALGVLTVFDLRGPAEIHRSGADRIPVDIRLRATPFVISGGPTAPHEAPLMDSETGRVQYMLNSYSRYPILEGARVAVGDVLRTVAVSGGATLVHCAAGKDRAGWTVATLLRTVGVTDEDIIADYLRSNEGIEPLRQRLREAFGERLELSDSLLGVDERYYRRAMETLLDHHGSFENYLDALDIDSDTVLRLRERLLV